MRFLSRLLASAALWFAAAGANSAAAPAPLRDIHYGSGAQQTLDVYRPPAAHGAPVAAAPIIVFVHGGGWRIGDKGMARMIDSKVQRWLPHGFVFVSIDYGLLPQTPVVRQADDVAHALAFVQQHAAEWGGDGDKVLLMGHSAGAHLVALLDAAPERARAAGARPWLGTIALDSAAYDLPALMQRRHLPLYDAAFGADPAQWPALSPLQQLHGAGPPLLAVCSSVRPDDPCADARRFAARAAAFERRVEVLPQPLSHAEINATLGAPGAYTDAVETFLKSLDPTVRRRLETAP